MSALPATLTLQTSGDETVDGFHLRETYQVFTTSSSDGPSDVLAAAGLPAMFTPLSTDPLSRVSARRPIRQENSTKHWMVEIEYSREKANSQDRQQPPTLRPVKRAAGIRWVKKALQKDKNGKPILTSAKTPFNPPIEVEVPHVVVKFQRWEENFTTQKIKTYAGKVNSTPYGVYGPGEVLCTNIEAQEEWEQDADGNLQRYWLVTYEFEASDYDKWQPFKILDADYWFIDPNDGLRKPIFVDRNGVYHGDPEDANGATPVPSPVPLDGPDGDEGDVLQASELPDDAHFLEFDIYEEADFNALELPIY